MCAQQTLVNFKASSSVRKVMWLLGDNVRHVMSEYYNRRIPGNFFNFGFNDFPLGPSELRRAFQEVRCGGKEAKYSLTSIIKILLKQGLYLYENSSICLQQKVSVWERNVIFK